MKIGDILVEKRTRASLEITDADETIGVFQINGDNEKWFTRSELLSITQSPRIPGVVYVSASQISLFARCKRKWAFKYIDKIPEPMRADPAFGIECHEAAEKFLLEGSFPVGTAPDVVATVNQGRSHWPTSHIEVEKEIEIHEPALGAMFAGYIDLVHYAPSSGARTPVVIDHKFTKNLRYAMTQKAMEEDIQANTYAKWAMDTYLAKEVTTQWIYYGAAGERPRETSGCKVVKRTKTANEIAKNWNIILGHTEQLVYLKKTKSSAAECEPNTEACYDYGGCFYKNICNVKRDFLDVKGTNTVSKLSEILNRKKQAAAATQKSAEINPPPVTMAPVTTAPVTAAPVATSSETPKLTKTGKIRKPRRTKAEMEAVRQGTPVETVVAAPVAVIPPEIVEPPKPNGNGHKAANHGGFYVAVDTLIAKGRAETITLAEFLTAIKDVVAHDNQVMHWNLVPYRQGEAILAALLKQALVECKPNVTILCDSRSDEWKACGDVLTETADFVFRGL